jgi:hypothetical protein
MYRLYGWRRDVLVRHGLRIEEQVRERMMHELELVRWLCSARELGADACFSAVSSVVQVSRMEQPPDRYELMDQCAPHADQGRWSGRPFERRVRICLRCYGLIIHVLTRVDLAQYCYPGFVHDLSSGHDPACSL